MRTRLKLILPAVLVLAGCGIAAWWSAQEADRNDTRLVLHGNVDIREVDLAFRPSERIAEMLVVEGERVAPGQPLARLEADRFHKAVELARARRDAQAEILRRLEAGSRPEEIKKAEAEAEAARVQMDDAKRTSARYDRLVEKGLVSRQSADTARDAYKAAKARFVAAQETLALARKGPREEDIAEARALLRSLQAQLDLAQRDLDDTVLKAPSSGVIRDRILEPGDMASPERPVYTLAIDDPVWVRAYVGEKDLGRIRPGMPAQVETDSFPGKSYAAWIGYISPTAEFTPKSVETKDVRTSLVYQVRAFVRNTDGELRLGMPATVTIDLSSRATAGASSPSSRP